MLTENGANREKMYEMKVVYEIIILISKQDKLGYPGV